MKLVIENRIPYTFFKTQGKGESDNTIHAGSYHLALRDAGIEMCNIMVYSSILPKEAIEIQKAEAILRHGAVLECIMSEAHGDCGEHISAGIMFGWLYDSDNQKMGGLVCEINGELTESEMNWKLGVALQELYQNGYQHLELRNIHTLYDELTVSKKYGTVLVGLCFTSYLINTIGSL